MYMYMHDVYSCVTNTVIIIKNVHTQNIIIHVGKRLSQVFVMPGILPFLHIFAFEREVIIKINAHSANDGKKIKLTIPKADPQQN